MYYCQCRFWGFVSATDRQNVKTLIQRCTRAGFYNSDPLCDFQELCNQADHRLFNKILESLTISCPGATVATTLPQSYDFRKRPHTRQIPNRCSHITNCNVLIRMFFADTYWWCFYLSLCLYYVFLTLTFNISVFLELWFVSFSITEYCIVVHICFYNSNQLTI